MAGTKVKFTRRLSVRLAAISILLVLAAIAIAQAQLSYRGETPSDPPPQPAAAPEVAVQPIPLPEGETPAGEEPEAPPPDSTSRFASLPEFPPARPAATTPPPAEDPRSTMIIRGKDEELPSLPQFDEPPMYGQRASAPTAADQAGPPPAHDEPEPSFSRFAPPTGLPSAPPAELDADLRDSARPALGAAPAAAGASVYGQLPEPPRERPRVVQASADDMGELAPPAEDADTFQAPAPPPAMTQPAYGLAAPRFDEPRPRGADELEEPAAFPETSPLGPEPRATTADSFHAPAGLGEPGPRGGGSRAAPADSFHAPVSASTDFAPPSDEAGFEGDGRPGGEALDGRQAPALTIEKLAPQEIQVGKETAFQVRIRNVGQVAAHDLIVLDRVPHGTRFVSARPQPTQSPDGQLMWQLGTLEPGDESIVSLNLLPMAEGEIGSVAQVLFQTHASVRTLCTRPELTVKHTGPARVLVGEAVVLDITVANPGTGAATGVVLVEDVPPGLAHAAGKELEYEVGTLKPGESRRLQLTLKADRGGLVENSLLVRGDGNLIARDKINLEVIAPALEVSLSGPRLRYLEREATYEVAVANPGTAAAREVELVTYLPKGMKFVAADHKGHYEPQNHAVYWSVEELPPRETGVAKLTLLPLETGEQKLSLEARAHLGLKHATEKLVQVDSLAELQFSVTDEADPIEVGSETTYVIHLSNRGSSAATQIQLLIGLPPELKPIGGEGPTKVVIEGPRMTVEPLAHLGPGEQAQYKLRVRGVGAGHQRFQVQLVTAEAPVPLTKEELTRVYVDH